MDRLAGLWNSFAEWAVPLIIENFEISEAEHKDACQNVSSNADYKPKDSHEVISSSQDPVGPDVKLIGLTTCVKELEFEKSYNSNVSLVPCEHACMTGSLGQFDFRQSYLSDDCLDAKSNSLVSTPPPSQEMRCSTYQDSYIDSDAYHRSRTCLASSVFDAHVGRSPVCMYEGPSGRGKDVRSTHQWLNTTPVYPEERAYCSSWNVPPDIDCFVRKRSWMILKQAC